MTFLSRWVNVLSANTVKKPEEVEKAQIRLWGTELVDLYEKPNENFPKNVKFISAFYSIENQTQTYVENKKNLDHYYIGKSSTGEINVYDKSGDQCSNNAFFKNKFVVLKGANHRHLIFHIWKGTPKSDNAYNVWLEGGQFK
jgi:hypothetical protein